MAKRRSGGEAVPDGDTPKVLQSPEVDILLSNDKMLFEKLRRDLMQNYLIEVEAGQDPNINPQHSRASRKQAKEIAELLIQLTSRGKA